MIDARMGWAALALAIAAILINWSGAGGLPAWAHTAFTEASPAASGAR